MCIGFMIPDATPFHECYLDLNHLQALDALGDQSAELQACRVFAVEHRCERIRAIVETCPQGSLCSRQFQPLGTTLGQKCAKAYAECFCVFGLVSRPRATRRGRHSGRLPAPQARPPCSPCSPCRREYRATQRWIAPQDPPKAAAPAALAREEAA